MELMVQPWRLGDERAAHTYEVLLRHLPNLLLADITVPVARLAARLRGQQHIGAADALQVAASLVHGATTFITNDHALARLHGALDVIILDDLSHIPDNH
jgi:predicted nucleic acid-binding protein